MKFAVGTFQSDLGISPIELAQAVEERGFDALFFADHTHIPAERRSPHPGGLVDLPPQYWHTLDPLITIAAVASVTKTLRLGVGVCLVTEREPIVTAKQLATADYLSDGRVILGVGTGWNLEEMANHGTDPATRFGVMRERVEAMKVIWTQDEATYHGTYVNFDRILCDPKPVQKPHMPILIGGEGERTLQRVVRYGDGWMPNLTRVPDFTERVEKLRTMAQTAGRSEPSVTTYSTPLKPEVLDTLTELRVERAVFFLDSKSRDESLEWLDRCIAVAREFEQAGV